MKLIDALCRNREFEQILSDNRERLYRIAFSWCHHADVADDLVQETCAKALKQRKQLRELDAMSPWLFRILMNTWHDHLRARKETVEFDEADFSEEHTPETVNSRYETVQRVRQSMAKLPLGQREVLTLVDLERFSYAEVAQILDIPAGTVMSRLSRARRQLKELLLIAEQDVAGRDSATKGNTVVTIRGHRT